MALLVTFVAIDKSNPPEAKKGKGDEKPSGGVEPLPYALSTEGVYVTRSGRCGHRPLRKRRKHVRYLARADRAVRPYNRLPSVRPSTKHPHHSTTSPPAAQPPLPRQLYVKKILSPISSTIRLLRAKLAQIYAKYARIAPGRNCKPPLRNGILY